MITKGLNYVYQTLQTLDDLYSLALAAYAAQLANYEHKDALLQKLDSYAKTQGNFLSEIVRFHCAHLVDF